MSAARVCVAVTLSLLAMSCRGEPSHRESSASGSATSAPATCSMLPAVNPPPVDESPGPLAEPAAPSAAASAKAVAVYRLLAGGRAARELREHSVDDGASFDPDLRDRLMPVVRRTR